MGQALCCLVSLSDEVREKYSPPFERLIPIRHGLAREAGIEMEILTWLVMNEIHAWKAPWSRVESGIVYDSLEVVRLHFAPSAPPIKREVEDGLWVLLRDGEADPGEPKDAPPSEPPKPPKQKNRSWPKSAQEQLGKLWSSYRATGGIRERDCYEEHKGTNRMPDCIKSFPDFQKCKEASEKNSFIQKLHKKRGKTKGKSGQVKHTSETL